MEKDCMYLVQGRNSSMMLQKILILIQNQITKNDTERLLTIIKQFLCLSTDGFYVQDLYNITHVVDILMEKSKQESVYIKHLDTFLEICSIPPLLVKSSDIIRYALDIQEYFSWLGQKFLARHIVNSLLTRLEPNWRARYPNEKPGMPRGDEILDISIVGKILPLVLEKATAQTMKAPTRFSLWSLQWTFRLFCLREATRLERNNILAILLMLMNVYPDLLSGNLTFCYDIAMLAMAQDVIFSPNRITECRLTPCNEDMCCMALLLMCISFYRHILTGPKVIEECRIVMGLLKLIGKQQAIKWKPLQSRYLINVSINILHNIVPISTEEFVEDGGPLIILELINEGRQFASTANYQIILRSVELLCHFCYKFKSICDSVAYNGGFNIILSLCNEYLEANYLSKNHQVLIAVSICLLEQIYHPEKARELLPMIIKYMNRYINPNPQDPVQGQRIIILTLSLIWNKIACSESLSKAFIEMDGIYLLLDIVQMSCLPTKIVALGVLIDLCEITECVPYLITWRRNGQRIKSLLLDTFRQENTELHVKVDQYGAIVDPLIPIMGEVQYYETNCPCRKFVGNPSIADLLISCRPKVYCLLQILEVRQRDVVETTDEFYKLFNEDLSREDQVTLLVAENFLALKLSEEWHELAKEFEKYEIEVIPSDQAIIESMLDVTNQWGGILQKMQRQILDDFHKKDKKFEESFYDTLKKSRYPEACEALKQMRYIAKCSERVFRLSAYYDTQQRIVDSLQYNEENGQFHPTNFFDVFVSFVKNQHVVVPTDVVEDVVPSLELPTFVSPAISLSIEDFMTDESFSDLDYL
ncbi:cilia- and flagella-associated protein 69-like isoform X2 [Sitophilus oryzae]|uniref:Cilia- and flagella-associated protein 69-like isoform X2 n=1 Tax=Sitophilus oryzae TaxID=7048 RepID=A0A6J2YQ02_SITOR|nr:cilia- and flagella-associated protein 69-like isoform X2 [Sitophilus oryzae]